MTRRVVLLLPRLTYRNDFLDAADALGAEVIVGADFRQAMADAMGDRALLLDFRDPDGAAAAIVDLHARRPIDAVVAADEQGVLVAATANARLGFRHNAPSAVASTRDKLAMRERLRAGGVPQPDFATSSEALTPAFPVVVKPRRLSGSQGVIRVDGLADLAATIARVKTIACHDEPVLIESFVPGFEVSVEGLLRDGQLEVLATFDKPDPLNGPTFAETIYVTPSRLAPAHLGQIQALVASAAQAIGLTEGAVHAEVRIDGPHDSTHASAGPARVWLIEIAGRSIGGLCSRTLRFGLGVTLEQLILRHALGFPLPPLRREKQAAGVLMLPTTAAGVLAAVRGVDLARSVPGIEGVEITVTPGTRLEPLPDGDRYLGFVFARGGSAADVEASLRAAWAHLRVELA